MSTLLCGLVKETTDMSIYQHYILHLIGILYFYFKGTPCNLVKEKSRKRDLNKKTNCVVLYNND